MHKTQLKFVQSFVKVARARTRLLNFESDTLNTCELNLDCSSRINSLELFYSEFFHNTTSLHCIRLYGNSCDISEGEGSSSGNVTLGGGSSPKVCVVTFGVVKRSLSIAGIPFNWI